MDLRMMEALPILDRMDALRRKRPGDDNAIRVCSAIVAEAVGFRNRNEWTEALSQDEHTQYYAYMNGLEA